MVTGTTIGTGVTTATSVEAGTVVMPEASRTHRVQQNILPQEIMVLIEKVMVQAVLSDAIAYTAEPTRPQDIQNLPVCPEASETVVLTRAAA